MITKNRQATIEWKLNPSVFEEINKKVFRTQTLRLGSSHKVVNSLMSNESELKAIMPILVGISSDNVNFIGAVQEYLHDFLLEVPKYGYKFDISLKFDIESPSHKTHIDKYIKEVGLEKKHKEEASEMGFEKYVAIHILKYVKEESLYKYCSFVNPKEYIEWRYCMLHNRVANNVSDVTKSNKIEFYLTSDEIKKEERAKTVGKTKESIGLLSKLFVETDKSRLENILIASNYITSLAELKSASLDELYEKLTRFQHEESDKFISIVNDKNLALKSSIRKYLWSGVLKQIPATSIIVDSNDESIIIGNNLEEAVSYFSNELNAGYVSMVSARHKNLIK